jgi:hypothetical protein
VKHPLGHFQRTSPSFPGLLLGRVCCLLLFVGTSLLHASDLPAPVTLDLPIAADLATPSWLGHPETPATEFAALNLPILTPDTTASLLVTVYFQEKQGGFLRIIWNGTQGAEQLSENFYEAIGMANQRSLLISPATLVGDGTLTFQCGDSNLGIRRIKLEWLESKIGLASPSVQDLLVTPATGSTQLAQSLSGQPTATEPGAWQNQLVTVPLTDSALRIDEGVEFSIDLDKVPGSARLSLQEAGLPLGRHLIVWVNQQRAGTITPAVPDLLDGGFLSDGSAATNYVGWRDGSFYVPVALLKEGTNTLQFSDEDDANLTLGNAGDSAPAAQQQPRAIKALVMQLNYLSPLIPPATTSSPPPQFLTTGPVPPPESTSASPPTTTP